MLVIMIIKAGAVLPPPTAEELEPVRLFTNDSTTTVLLHMGRRPTHWKIIMKVVTTMMMMMTAPDSITIGQ